MPASRSRSCSRQRSRSRRDTGKDTGKDHGKDHGPPPQKGVTVWVGGLPPTIAEDQIKRVFGSFGRLVDIRLKLSNGSTPPFAFVEFVHFDDAEEACKVLDQSTELSPDFPIKVSMSNSSKSTGKSSKGKGRSDSRGRKGYPPAEKGYGKGGYGHSKGPSSYYNRPPPSRHDSRAKRYDDRGSNRPAYNDRYDDRSPGPRRGGYKGGKGPSSVPSGQHKITLSHLPHDMTWTELKELGKQYTEQGEVTFARTFRDRDGVACGLLEFRERDDADSVLSRLNGKKIKGHDARLIVRHGDR